ncbi:MAG TPA: MFS transporter [Acidobacteriota bacterium]|nr:MFS transporter [Acidobacteriota bacterium]
MFYGWRVACACFTNLFVVVGIIYYSFPVFYAPLIEEFGWSRAQVTAGFFLSMVLVGPIFGISAGFLIDRYGSRKILLAGLAFAGVAFLGFGRMHSLPLYYLFYFMQTVGYVSAGPIPNQVLISQWFARMRGRAMGIAYVGIGVGGAVAPVFAQYLTRHFGWRAAMFTIGGIILLVLVPLTIVLVKNRPAEMGLFPDGGRQSETATRQVESAPVPLAHAVKSAAFWLILLGSLMSIGAVGGVIQHLQLYLRDQSFTPEKAALVASYLLISSIVGRLTMGYLADRFPKKYVMLAACLLVACAIPALYSVATPGVIYIFAIVFGFGMGADYMLIPLITAECFGVSSLGKLMGVILTTDALSQAFAPVVVSRIYDLHKSYYWGFAVLIGMATAGALAVSQIPRKPRPEASV